MEFEEMFGFKTAAGGTLRAAQQMAVDATLNNLARACSGAADTLNELRRALKGIEIPDSASVSAFASVMAKIEKDATDAKASFDRAVQLARAAGFTVRGRVEDMEVKQIFGLDEVHRPITAGEQTKINKTLMILAIKFHIARLAEEKDRREGATDVKRYNALFGAIAPAKRVFWEAHGVASRIGAGIWKTYEEYVPEYLRFRIDYQYLGDAIRRLEEYIN